MLKGRCNKLFVSSCRKKRKSHVSILSWSQITVQGRSLGFGTWLQLQQILHRYCWKALQKCISKGRLALSERPYVYGNLDPTSTGIDGNFSTEFVSFSSKSYSFLSFSCAFSFSFLWQGPKHKEHPLASKLCLCLALSCVCQSLLSSP